MASTRKAQKRAAAARTRLARRVWLAFRISMFAIWSVAVLYTVVIALSDPSSEQPSRNEALELLVEPREPDAYMNGLVAAYNAVVSEGQLNFLQRLGLQPRQPVIRVDISVLVTVKDSAPDGSLVLTPSADVEFAEPNYNAPSVEDDGSKTYKRGPWQSLSAHHDHTFAVLTGRSKHPSSQGEVAIARTTFWVRSSSLTRSYELENGVRVQYNGVSLKRSATVGGLNLLEASDASQEGNFNDDIQRGIDELRSESAGGASRAIYVCPQCMPITSYKCSERVEKDEYWCWGGVAEPLEAAWTTPSYPWCWLMPIAGEVEVSLAIGGAVLFALGPFRRWARKRSKLVDAVFNQEDRFRS